MLQSVDQPSQCIVLAEANAAASLAPRRIDHAGIHVLLIEDDARTERLLAPALDVQGYALTLTSSIDEGVRLAATRNPDIIIVDGDLPDRSRFDVIRRLREWYVKPIVVLSAGEDENEKVAALDLGADDYLTKPFSLGELLARLRVAVRRLSARGGSTNQAVAHIGDITIDFAACRVHRNGADLHLTPTEYRLLRTLVKHRGKVPTHRQLLHEVWGPSHLESPEYLRIYMRSLRRKLEADPARPRWLLTETGVGYRLAEATAM